MDISFVLPFAYSVWILFCSEYVITCSKFDGILFFSVYVIACSKYDDYDNYFLLPGSLALVVRRDLEVFLRESRLVSWSVHDFNKW